LNNLDSVKLSKKEHDFSLQLVAGLSVVCSCVAAASAQSVEQSLAQTLNQSAGPTAQSYQGSVTAGEATGPTIDLTLDDAIQRGLKNNLGVILSGTQTASTRGQRLSQLQSLLPSVDASIKDVVSEPIWQLRDCGFRGFRPSSGPSATRISGPL